MRLWSQDGDDSYIVIRGKRRNSNTPALLLLLDRELNLHFQGHKVYGYIYIYIYIYIYNILKRVNASEKLSSTTFIEVDNRNVMA